MANTDLRPTTDDYYIVYKTTKKDAFLECVVCGVSTTLKGGPRTITTIYPSNRINEYTTIEEFNVELERSGGGANKLFWDPYDINESPPPVCGAEEDYDADGNCIA